MKEDRKVIPVFYGMLLLQDHVRAFIFLVLSFTRSPWCWHYTTAVMLSMYYVGVYLICLAGEIKLFKLKSLQECIYVYRYRTYIFDAQYIVTTHVLVGSPESRWELMKLVFFSITGSGINAQSIWFFFFCQKSHIFFRKYMLNFTYTFQSWMPFSAFRAG